MSKISPGILARVVAKKGFPIVTPEIIGRIVFVEREHRPEDIFQTVDGQKICDTMKNKEAAWVISAREPLPMVVERGFNAMRVYTYERPILEVCLRPLLDPDLGVTDEEVKELYSPKQRAEDHATVIQWPAFFPEKT